MRRAKDLFHGLSEGEILDEDEEVDGVSMEMARFPDPVRVFDEEIVVRVDTVIIAGQLMESDAFLAKQRSQRDFTCSTDIRFGPFHRDDFSNEVE